MAVLIIGYGNPLRQDDGLGWHVAERLSARAHPGVDIVACHQLAPELAEPISNADLVVFVDARQGAEPGRVTLEAIEPVAQATLTFSHVTLPCALLGLAGELYGACPPAWMVTVDGEAFGHGGELTPAVAAAMETAVGQIDALVCGHLQRRTG